MDRTFSLLPLQLVPFRRMSLRFMLLAVLQRIVDSLSYLSALSVIAEKLVDMGPDISFLHVSALVDWEIIVREALERIRSSEGLCIGWFEGCSPGSAAEVQTIVGKTIAYESTDLSPPIRGPDALAWDYHQHQGGPLQRALFLFGTASQHRRLYR